MSVRQGKMTASTKPRRKRRAMKPPQLEQAAYIRVKDDQAMLP